MQPEISEARSYSGFQPLDALRVLGHSGLFDADYYVGCNPDLAGLGSEALAHYHRYGWREGRKPNLYFDPNWYRAQYAEVAAAEIDPLLHYINVGEAQGCRPIAWFDPLWYADTYTPPAGMTALRHFLLHRQSGSVNAMSDFDSAFYLRAYPDVAAAGLDPLEHYMVQGFREARRPFEGFDPVFYRQRYLAGLHDANPLLHYLENRSRPDIHPAPPRLEASIPREVRHNTRPGPFFETVRPLPPTVARHARVLAYYLPQFHAMPQNDEWWGTGFTEWTNIARALPRFAGHYQPRIPRDLGHYRLEGSETLRRQADMARAAGIEGFIFYFYWFNGTRLLDAPLEALLADRSIDLPFCLMWANENWTRRWDGSDHEVLISQDFRGQDDAALIDCYARHFADPRYIRLHGRPLLMIYRAAIIPDTEHTIARWRALFAERCGENPIFVMAQAFGDHDPRPHGMDGAIEFPPHKVVEGLATINDRLHVLDPDFTAQTFDYDDVVDRALSAPAPDYPLIRTACPSWDNDARREGAGLVMHGSTPAKYQAWLEKLVRQALAQPFHGSPIVCVNAWNEWAEGATLEPDLHHGAAYLNATARAVTGFGHAASTVRGGRVLLVGHDAFRAGAQSLLLHMAQQLKRAHGVEVRILLLGGGALLDAYRAAAATRVAALSDPELAAHLRQLRGEGFDAAIVNTAASAAIGRHLHEAGIAYTLLVHELPALLAEKGLIGGLSEAWPLARGVVFSAKAVEQSVSPLARSTDLPATDTPATDTPAIGAPATGAPVASTPVRVLPQGLYRSRPFSARTRATLRQTFAVAANEVLLVGAGYGDMRKGFDLFLQLWRLTRTPARSRTRRVHCLWLGDLDPSMRLYLAAEIDAAIASGSFHMPGHVPDASEHFSAADAFVLTSREDPLPTVVMEAMASGLSCVAFKGSGGIPELIDTHGMGATVPLGDVAAMAREAVALACETRAWTPGQRAAAGRQAAKRFSFGRYVSQLLCIAEPAMPRISVVVPSFNYARYMRQRLASVFAQSHPVLEIIVLDDASSDDSVEVARAAAAEWNRDIRVIAASRNSGSVFRQWQRAAQEARGDWIWIAEADDAADPRLLERLTQAIASADDAAPVMAFCDSRSIDEDGALIADSYKPYYATTAGSLLDQDGLHEGSAFIQSCLAERNLILNASSVLFARGALKAALARCGEDLFAFRMAGDWRLYIEILREAGARIAYVAEPLNIHRRHGTSATHRLVGQEHIGEVARIHRLVGNTPTLLDADCMRQRAYRDQLARQFGLRLAGD